MRRFKAVVLKEIIHIRRDKRTLTMLIFMPFIQLIIYGYAVNTDVKHLATVVYNEDRTPLSRRLIESFRQSSYFDFKIQANNIEELRRALDRGQAKAGLHIPPGFAKNLLAGKSSQLQLLIDGTDSNPANTALNTSQAVITAFAQAERVAAVSAMPIDFRPRMWYNPDLKSSLFMVPGLIGLLLQILIPMVTATAVVREKEKGTMEQLLVTPIKRHEFIMGKITPYVFIGLLIAGLIIGAARLLFGVHVRGSVFLLFALTLLFLMVCLGIGLLASAIAQNQQQASTTVMMIAPASILLSGFIFPREAMPAPIYFLGYVIPLTYYLKIVRGIVLKGLGFMDVWQQVIPLILIGSAIIALSILKFRKRLA